MNTKIVSIFICLVLFSCSYKTEVKNDLVKLMSNPITLPNKSVITFKGEDTLVVDYFKSDYKMVIYADSMICTSCGITDILLWEPLIAYANTFNNRLKFYFIFSTPNSKEIRNALKTKLFNYPVLIDEKGEFKKLNPHLPKNKSLHAFLLDENNKVIMVGNPLRNKELEKLFYKQTQKLLD